MILFPLNSPVSPAATAPQPVWDAIFRRQKQPARKWWLVTQSDHAELSGELASRIALPGVGELDEEILQAISLHDYGWNAVDDLNSPKTDGDGRPLSFLETEPADILRAWLGSIGRAELVAPIGGILVSEHFSRIARDFVHGPKTSPPVAQALTTFLERELDRQEELRARQSCSLEEILLLVDVLQFCDLLSLYVCCGARENVYFPQQFTGLTIGLWRDGECCRMQPSIIQRGVSLGIEAREFSPAGRPSAVTIPILFS